MKKFSVFFRFFFIVFISSFTSSYAGKFDFSQVEALIADQNEEKQREGLDKIRVEGLIKIGKDFVFDQGSIEKTIELMLKITANEEKTKDVIISILGSIVNKFPYSEGSFPEAWKGRKFYAEWFGDKFITNIISLIDKTKTVLLKERFSFVFRLLDKINLFPIDEKTKQTFYEKTKDFALEALKAKGKIELLVCLEVLNELVEGKQYYDDVKNAANEILKVSQEPEILEKVLDLFYKLAEAGVHYVDAKNAANSILKINEETEILRKILWVFYKLVNKGQHYEDAKNAANKILEISNNPEVLKRLLWVFYELVKKRQHYEDAKNAANKILEISNDPEVLERLFWVFHELVKKGQHYEDAKNAANKILEISNDPETLERILRIFDELVEKGQYFNDARKAGEKLREHDDEKIKGKALDLLEKIKGREEKEQLQVLEGASIITKEEGFILDKEKVEEVLVAAGDSLDSAKTEKVKNRAIKLLYECLHRFPQYTFDGTFPEQWKDGVFPYWYKESVFDETLILIDELGTFEGVEALLKIYRRLITHLKFFSFDEKEKEVFLKRVFDFTVGVTKQKGEAVVAAILDVFKGLISVGFNDPGAIKDFIVQALQGSDAIKAKALAVYAAFVGKGLHLEDAYNAAKNLQGSKDESILSGVLSIFQGAVKRDPAKRYEEVLNVVATLVKDNKNFLVLNSIARVLVTCLMVLAKDVDDIRSLEQIEKMGEFFGTIEPSEHKGIIELHGKTIVDLAQRALALQKEEKKEEGAAEKRKRIIGDFFENVTQAKKKDSFIQESQVEDFVALLEKDGIASIKDKTPQEILDGLRELVEGNFCFDQALRVVSLYKDSKDIDIQKALLFLLKKLVFKGKGFDQAKDIALGLKGSPDLNIFNWVAQVIKVLVEKGQHYPGAKNFVDEFIKDASKRVKALIILGRLVEKGQYLKEALDIVETLYGEKDKETQKWILWVLNDLINKEYGEAAELERMKTILTTLKDGGVDEEIKQQAQRVLSKLEVLIAAKGIKMVDSLDALGKMTDDPNVANVSSKIKQLMEGKIDLKTRRKLKKQQEKVEAAKNLQKLKKIKEQAEKDPTKLEEKDLRELEKMEESDLLKDLVLQVKQHVVKTLKVEWKNDENFCMEQLRSFNDKLGFKRYKAFNDIETDRRKLYGDVLGKILRSKTILSKLRNIGGEGALSAEKEISDWQKKVIVNFVNQTMKGVKLESNVADADAIQKEVLRLQHKMMQEIQNEMKKQNIEVDLLTEIVEWQKKIAEKAKTLGIEAEFNFPKVEGKPAKPKIDIKSQIEKVSQGETLKERVLLLIYGPTKSLEKMERLEREEEELLVQKIKEVIEEVMVPIREDRQIAEKEKITGLACNTLLEFLARLDMFTTKKDEVLRIARELEKLVLEKKISVGNVVRLSQELKKHETPAPEAKDDFATKLEEIKKSAENPLEKTRKGIEIVTEFIEVDLSQMVSAGKLPAVEEQFEKQEVETALVFIEELEKDIETGEKAEFTKEKEKIEAIRSLRFLSDTKKKIETLEKNEKQFSGSFQNKLKFFENEIVKLKGQETVTENELNELGAKESEIKDDLKKVAESLKEEDVEKIDRIAVKTVNNKKVLEEAATSVKAKIIEKYKREYEKIMQFNLRQVDKFKLQLKFAGGDQSKVKEAKKALYREIEPRLLRSVTILSFLKEDNMTKDLRSQIIAWQKEMVKKLEEKDVEIEESLKDKLKPFGVEFKVKTTSAQQQAAAKITDVSGGASVLIKSLEEFNDEFDKLKTGLGNIVNAIK